MLISVQHLVDRLRHPRSRADEIAKVRRRLASAAEGASAEEAAIALDLRRLREALIAALGEVDACAGCAKGHPLPHGRFTGGHCCGARTDELWTDAEAAALRLGGTVPSRLTPPTGDHAGCAFRGPTGCSLDPVDRPNICVRYICRELEAELRDRGDLPGIKAIAADIARAFARFERLREARLAGAGDPIGP